MKPCPGCGCDHWGIYCLHIAMEHKLCDNPWHARSEMARLSMENQEDAFGALNKIVDFWNSVPKPQPWPMSMAFKPPFGYESMPNNGEWEYESRLKDDEEYTKLKQGWDLLVSGELEGTALVMKFKAPKEQACE